jgi:hypothetical protein
VILAAIFLGEGWPSFRWGGPFDIGNVVVGNCVSSRRGAGMNGFALDTNIVSFDLRACLESFKSYFKSVTFSYTKMKIF